MRLRCASCGERPRGGLWRTVWCPECRTLSCNMCRRYDHSDCPVCGTDRHGRDYFGMFLVVTLVLSFVTIIFVALGASGLWKQLPAESMPYSDIGALSVPAHVKVRGILAANGTVAIDGAYIDGDWEYTTRAVRLESLHGGANITLNLAPGSDIYKGTHPSDKPGASGHPVYRTGDRVVAVGNLARNSTGATVLDVELLRPADGSFVKPENVGLTVYIPALVWSGLAVFFLAIAPLPLISEKTADAPGFVFKKRASPEYFPAGTATIMMNTDRRFYLKFRLGFYSASALTVLFFFILAFIGVFPFADPEATYISVLIPSVFLVVFSVMGTFEHRNSPVSASFDNTGFSLDYGHRTEGYRWSDVSSMEAPMRKEKSKMMHSAHIEMDLVDGRETTIVNISDGVSDAIREKFRQFRPEIIRPTMLDILGSQAEFLRSVEEKIRAKATADRAAQERAGLPADVQAVPPALPPRLAPYPPKRQAPVPGIFQNTTGKEVPATALKAAWGVFLVLTLVVISGFFLAGDSIIGLVFGFGVLFWATSVASVLIVTLRYYFDLSAIPARIELGDAGFGVTFRTGRTKRYAWDTIEDLTIFEKEGNKPGETSDIMMSVPGDIVIIDGVERALAVNVKAWFETRGDNERLRFHRKLEAAEAAGATPLEIIALMRQNLEQMKSKMKER